MSFTGKTKASTYKDILQLDNSNTGVGTTLATVKDGEGVSSCLAISDDNLLVRPQNDDTANAFDVRSSANAQLLVVDSTNSLIKAGLTQTAVNTQIQHFGFGSGHFLPASTNWHGIPSFGQETQSRLEMGSGSTPNTSLTVSINGDDVVGHIFYVPVNLTIDSCSVWVGADAASGDTVQFSVMSYDIDTSNSSTGGDLSNGAEHCVSPSTITSLGYEQSYFSQLTVSSANVDAGKVIMAFIKSDGTNSDYSVNMNLVYHIR